MKRLLQYAYYLVLGVSISLFVEYLVFTEHANPVKAAVLGALMGPFIMAVLSFSGFFPRKGVGKD